MFVFSDRQYGKGELKFSSLTFEDSGMYQCIAENEWGTIYANAELRVVCELCEYFFTVISSGCDV